MSVYDLGVNLFDTFKDSDFFSPAFYDFEWTEVVRTGPISGGTVNNVVHSGTCAEKGGSAKSKKVSTIDGISNTDKYIIGKVEEVGEPPLNQEVTFDGDTFTVVYTQIDPVKATIEMFLRA